VVLDYSNAQQMILGRRPLMATDEKGYPHEAAQVEAVFCDTYFLNIWPEYLRIAFGEHLRDRPYYRSAIAMPISDAKSLAKDILELVERIEKDKAKEAKG
jgi:hypothetical protein